MQSPMSLSRENVADVAMLARLGLSEAEQERLRAELDAILGHISALDAVGITGVPETAQVTGLVNVWRDDLPRPSIGAEAALRNAPESDGEHFVVGAIQE
jgi:aspartyl-tRNA(Asn)/glutamyl-tRNA(Gln) amidotransferase subunit C